MCKSIRAARPAMKPDRIVKLLKLVGIQQADAHARSGWVISSCPLGPWEHEGGKSSPTVFGVKIEQGDPNANCFACGWRGTLMELIITMRHRNKVSPALTVKWSEAMKLIEEAEDDLALDLDSPTVEELFMAGGAAPALHQFPEWWLETFLPVDGFPKAQAYLKARGVSPTLADHMDLRWDSGQERICFPVRDFKWTLRGLHGRAIDPDVDPRYRMYTQAGKNNPLVWLGEHWVDLTQPIVVVEGPFDLASVYRVYRNVVSPLFNSPSFEKLHRMGHANEWITLLDKGTGGDTGRKRISKAMGGDHVVHHLTLPDGVKDPGEATIQALQDTLGPFISLDDPID